MRESMREETIRALQTPEIIADTNRHFYITGKLEAIDEELIHLQALAHPKGIALCV